MILKKTTVLAITVLFLSVQSLFVSLDFAFANKKTRTEFEVDAASAMAFDQKTGKIFYAKDPGTNRGIASITKIMTVYIILEKIRERKLKWTDGVEIGEYPFELTKNTDLSNIPLERKPSRPYMVRELVDASLISSASSCAIALAEKVAGSEAKFVKLINKQLKKWNIKNAKIINVTGLNNSSIPEKYRPPGTKSDDENMMSARDLGIVTYHLLKEYPEILNITKKTTEKFGTGTSSEVDLGTWNSMLPGKDFECEGVNGLKTGTTDLAGQCFVGTCSRQNQQIVTIVLDAAPAGNNAGARFTETADLLDYVFDNWKQEKIASKGEKIKDVRYAPVKDGKKIRVPLAIGEDITSWVRTDLDPKKLKTEYKPGKQLIAPVEKGRKFGKVKVSLEDDHLGYLLKPEQQRGYWLETAGTVEREFFLKVWASHLLSWINSKLG